MTLEEQIALTVNVQWELAKGHMNAVVTALGQLKTVVSNNEDKFPFELMKNKIDRFVKEIEDEELYIP